MLPVTFNTEENNMGFLKQLLNKYISGSHQGRGGHGSKHSGAGKHGDRYGYSQPTWPENPISGNPQEKICSTCNTRNVNTAKFCQQCGTSISASHCSQCGVNLLPDAKFCPQCGKARS